MIKNKEEIVEKVVAKFKEKVEKYLEGATTLDEQENLNLDNFEDLWTIMNKEAKEIVEDLSNDIVNNISEKDLISKKKLSTTN